MDRLEQTIVKEGGCNVIDHGPAARAPNDVSTKFLAVCYLQTDRERFHPLPKQPTLDINTRLWIDRLFLEIIQHPIAKKTTLSIASPDSRCGATSTGFVEQHKEHRYGSKLPVLWRVLTSRIWIEIPINAYLLEHNDGLVLFDTGMDPAIVSDPDYISSAIGRFLLSRIFSLHIGADDRLSSKLAGLGFTAADVRKAVISRLHFDHVGGIADIPQAELLVSADEWQLGSDPLAMFSLTLFTVFLG